MSESSGEQMSCIFQCSALTDMQSSGFVVAVEKLKCYFCFSPPFWKDCGQEVHVCVHVAGWAGMELYVYSSLLFLQTRVAEKVKQWANEEEISIMVREFLKLSKSLLSSLHPYSYPLPQQTLALSD